MIDPTPFEQQAMNNASDMAGEYLESLNKTDLLKFTSDEWITLITVICTEYSDSLHRAHHRLEDDLARLVERNAPPLSVA